MTCSMSRRGNCFDNAVMEGFFSTVKAELGEHFECYGIAKEQAFDYIEVFYNPRRRHSARGANAPSKSSRPLLANCSGSCGQLSNGAVSIDGRHSRRTRTGPITVDAAAAAVRGGHREEHPRGLYAADPRT